MPVPAFRNSRSRVRRRRSHHALKPVRVTVDEKTGEMVLPHHHTIAEAPVAETGPKAKKQAKEAKKEEVTEGNDHAHGHDHDHADHTHA